MLDAVLDLLVAASPDVLALNVGASPVEGVLVVRWLVDKLSPVLSEGLGVGLTGPANVELIGDLNVDGGLNSNLTLLVVLGFEVDIGLSATHVGGSDVKSTSELPLLLGLLDLTGAGKVDLPAIVVDELALAFKRELVVGEDQLGSAVTMVLLDGSASLLDLSDGIFTVDSSDFLLDLLFCADIDVLLGLGGEGDLVVDVGIVSIGIVSDVAETAVGAAEKVPVVGHNLYRLGVAVNHLPAA